MEGITESRETNTDPVDVSNMKAIVGSQEPRKEDKESQTDNEVEENGIFNTDNVEKSGLSTAGNEEGNSELTDTDSEAKKSGIFRPDEEVKKSGLSRMQKILITAGVGAAVAAPIAVFVAPVVLAGVGFTSSGVAAGSLAAGVQSIIGNVAAGSLFAALQSAGAAGIGVGANVAIGAAAAGLGAGVGVAGAAIVGSGQDTDGVSGENGNTEQGATGSLEKNDGS